MTTANLRRGILAIALGVVATATAIVAPAAHADALDDAFTAAAERELGLDLDESTARALGTTVCEGVAMGYSNDVLGGFAAQGGSPKITHEQGIKLVEIVRAHYCPML
jgi:hypothetical protein